MQKRSLLIIAVFVLLELCLFGVSLSGAVNTAGNVAENGTPAVTSELICDKKAAVLTPHEASLIIELEQLMGLLNAKFPVWNGGAKLSEQRETIIKSFIASLGMALKYTTEKYHNPETNVSFNPLPLIWYERNQIAYLRLDGFNPEVVLQFRQIHDILLADYRLSGVIIDLRSCRSFDYKSALLCLDQLSKVVAGRKKTGGKLRFALLSGAETLGAGEYFIYSLRQTFTPVVIGGKSAGQLFEYRSEKFSDSGYILLPQIPEAVRETAIFDSQVPTIKIVNNVQKDYNLQQRNPDVTVKYATALLIALKSTAGALPES